MVGSDREDQSHGGWEVGVGSDREDQAHVVWEAGGGQWQRKSSTWCL